MGVTISHAIGVQQSRVPSVLDRTVKLAEEMKAAADKAGIPFTIRRPCGTELYVDIGGCETLSFVFQTFESYMVKNGWSYERSTLEGYFAHDVLNTDDSEHLKRWPGQRMLWSSSFCKTQFAKTLAEHRMVAELIRSVASRADYAHVNDEADYYHTLLIDDAAEAIAENGELIDSIGKMLSGQGYEYIKGNSTTIKPRKRKEI